jgi:hypothetical protein
MNRFVWLLFLIPLCSISQQTYTGIIKNHYTNESLSFANIKLTDLKLFHSNIYGNFEFETSKTIREFTVSYVGFQPKTIKIIPNTFHYEVYLTPKTEQLNEVIIQASENESLRIVKNIIENEPMNNLLKNLSNFNYNAYNKTVISANPDSISAKIDTIFKVENGKRVLKKVDSSSFKMKNILDKRHLYISEKISNFHYKKGSEVKEEILGVRIAGFKQPLYEILSLNFSDFNIYDENYIIAGTKYINPISNQGLKEYRYKILDTVKTENGNSLMVYFKPKKTDENTGLEGVLFVDSNRFSITKAILELKGLIYIKLTQEFGYDNTINNWFPMEKVLIMSRGTNQKNISLFGGMVKFEQEKATDSTNTSRKKPSNFVQFTSTTANSNFIFNDLKPIASFAEKIKINDTAHLKTKDFWNQFRLDSISLKDQKTYQEIDSILLKRNIEHKIELARELIKGYYPTKYFNFNLAKILTLNNYEGLRIGVGGETNRNISDKYKLAGYLAYGTKDNDFKFQYGASTRLHKYYNTWLGVHYTNDLKEAAALDFMLDNTSFSLLNPRNLNISDFYQHKTISVNLTHDILPNLESKLKLTTGDYKTVFDYAYLNQAELKSNYHLTDLSVGLLYSPFTDYMRTPIGKIKITAGFTDFLFQATQSFDGLLEGDYNFTQLIF